jgi:hypothetical protein
VEKGAGRVPSLAGIGKTFGITQGLGFQVHQWAIRHGR